MQRSELAVLGGSDTRELVTDSTGSVRFEGLTAGEWDFSLVVDGFAESSFTCELPWRWSTQLEELGYLGFGDLKMAPITPLLVQLDGHMDWEAEDPGFRIAAGPDEEPVEFDAFGRATVPLGWLGSPVYLKLFYPSAQRLGLYLDMGMPEAGTPIEIKVGKGRKNYISIILTYQVKIFIHGFKSFVKGINDFSSRKVCVF